MSMTRENWAMVVRFSASVRASSSVFSCSGSLSAISHFSPCAMLLRRARSRPCTITRTDPSPSFSIRTIVPSDFYRGYVDALVAQRDDLGALRVAESSRARVLAERLGRDPKTEAFPDLAGLRAFA